MTEAERQTLIDAAIKDQAKRRKGERHLRDDQKRRQEDLGKAPKDDIAEGTSDWHGDE